MQSLATRRSRDETLSSHASGLIQSCRGMPALLMELTVSCRHNVDGQDRLLNANGFVPESVEEAAESSPGARHARHSLTLKWNLRFS